MTRSTSPGDVSALVWFKSSYSSSSEGDSCVEVATTTWTVGVRDSKDPTGPVLTFNPHRWNDFINKAKASQFDI